VPGIPKRVHTALKTNKIFYSGADTGLVLLSKAFTNSFAPMQFESFNLGNMIQRVSAKP
jgi:hypothetical protein